MSTSLRDTSVVNPTELPLNKEAKNKVIDLETYETKLLHAVKDGSKSIFTNADQEHAAVAFSVLFKNTSSSLKIIAESFSGEISDNPKYVDALKNCLANPELKAEVLVLNKPNLKSLGFQEFLKSRKELHNVEIKIATPQSEIAIKLGMNNSLLSFGEIHNMAIFDDDKYRLEYLPSQYTAFLAFNDQVLAKEYANTFNTAFAAGISLPE